MANRLARVLALTVLAVPLALHQFLIWSAASRVTPLERAPSRATAIVLGASVRPDGRPSHMLDDRLRTAARLFASGKVQDVLVTGDGGGDGYDEVAVMRRELIGHGVPPDAIRVDNAGFRTIESMFRAREDFGVQSALVVTNAFHLHRAVYLARCASIDAIGVAAVRAHRYSAATLARHHAREALARLLACVEGLWR